jgi:hypothetical protein
MTRFRLSKPERLGDDLIWGVDGPNGIAAFLKLKPAAYYLIYQKKLPVRKLSHRRIVASRAALRQALVGISSNAEVRS